VKHKSLMVAAFFVLLSACFGQTQASSGASPQFLYVNDSNFFNVINQVEGFSISRGGTLTPLAGSPFLTGGKTGIYGVGGYAGRDLAVTPDGHFLYAANQGTADISVFRVDLATGALTVSPTRYAVFPNTRHSQGAYMAMSSSGKFLFAASGSPLELQTFVISSSGALQYASVPLPELRSQALDMIVTPDDKYLLVSDETHGVHVYSISAEGELTEVAGSPTVGQVSGITLDCSGQHMYLGDAQNTGTMVEGFSIADDGSLTALPGSPYQAAGGNNSNTVILDSDGKFLYVANQYSSQLSSFGVADDGSLAAVPTSPFADGNPGDQPAQMALGRSGLLFAAGTPLSAFPSVNVFRRSRDGGLHLAAGSPVFLSTTAQPVSLITIPAASCAP